jgi:membrane protein DedA with SNARE-associated domain
VSAVYELGLDCLHIGYSIHMHPDVQHVPALLQTLVPTIDRYGYWAVFGLLVLEDFGVPAPGETVLIAAAFYAGLGHLNIFLVALVGFVGAVLGDNIGFAIGTYGGHPLVERLGKYVFLTPERISTAEHFFNRHGGQLVTGARFVEGFRQINGIIAGLSEMRWLAFLAYNMLGAALWVSCWSAIGYFGGSHIETFLRYQLYVTIVVTLVVVVFVGVKVAERKRKH